MTIKEYYKEIDALKAPTNLSLFDQIGWLEARVRDIRKKLNVDQLKEVLADQARFKDKMNS